MMPKTMALLSAILLAGCGSSPKVSYYALTIAPAHARHERISSPVQLAAVHLPPSLDREKMVRMTGDNKVVVSETNRWSGDLGEMMRNVLSEDLAARLPAGKVILPDAPAPSGTDTLVVTIAQFGPDASGRVKLAGSWALVNATTGAVTQESDFHLDAGPAPKWPAVAAAMSRALGQLSTDIAAGLSASGP